MSNPYQLGSVECNAYAMGEEYARLIGHNDDNEPLSGEWADGPHVPSIVGQVMTETLGSGATEDDATPEEWDAICDAWEAGYFEAF